MQTARRLYLYLLSGIGLGVLVSGLSMLLTVLLEQLGLGPRGELGFGGDDPVRQQLTLASALTVVALPVWLLHWRAVERSVAHDRPDAALERTSGVRGLYFAIALGALLLVAATGLASAIEVLVLRVAGSDELDFRGLGDGLAGALVAGAAWLYHVRLRTRDWAVSPMSGDGAWLPRAYLYLATFAGLLVLLGAVHGVVELIGQLLLDVDPVFVEPGTQPWAFPLATAISGLLAGGAIFIGHTAYAERLVADPGWRGASERPARLRLAYFVAVIAVAAGAVIYLVADGLGNALAAAFGVPAGVTSAETASLVIIPIAGAVGYGIAWWLHVRRLRAEAEVPEDPGRAPTVGRLVAYTTSGVGLAFGAVGLVWVVGIFIRATLGGGQVLAGEETTLRELAQFVPVTVLGMVVWQWQWTVVNGRWAADPVGEAASTTRRAMLLIVLAASVLAAILSTGYIVYRLFGSVFGVEQSSDALGELSLPIAGLLVGIGVALYHAALLRRDLGLRTDAEVTPDARVVPATAMLRLTGPAEADLDAAISALRGHLPAGYALEVTGGDARQGAG